MIPRAGKTRRHGPTNGVCFLLHMSPALPAARSQQDQSDIWTGRAEPCPARSARPRRQRGLVGSALDSRARAMDRPGGCRWLCARSPCSGCGQGNHHSLGPAWDQSEGAAKHHQGRGRAVLAAAVIDLCVMCRPAASNRRSSCASCSAAMLRTLARTRGSVMLSSTTGGSSAHTRSSRLRFRQAALASFVTGCVQC